MYTKRVPAVLFGGGEGSSKALERFKEQQSRRASTAAVSNAGATNGSGSGAHTGGSLPSHSVTSHMVGQQVLVVGYGPGTLLYYGRHATKPGFRCGVELKTAGAGKHGGTVDGYHYFACAEGAGVLVDPRKVSSPGEL